MPSLPATACASTLAADGVKVLAADHEPYAFSVQRKFDAYITVDGTGADDGNFHLQDP